MKIKYLAHDDVKQGLSQAIYSALLKAFPLLAANANWQEMTIYGLLGEPPKPEMGHYAFPCFNLSKELRLGPPQIAAKIKEHLPSGYALIAKAQVMGPYLNFELNISEVGSMVLDSIIDGRFFKKKLTDSAPKTMIEYSQPNTHKELHVGHMRNLALGHALSLLYRYSGYPLITATYPGDSGTHVAKCLWFLKYHLQETIPSIGKGTFLGRIYVAATKKLEDETGTPQEEVNRRELGAILKQLNEKKGEFYDLWKETREWSLDLMRQIYDWAGVKFDQWYYESEVDDPSLELAKRYFKEGKLVESEGAIGMDLSEEGLGFCLLIKSDGNGLYATKDVELARRKFENFNIEKNIYVVDERQSFHFKQLFKVLEKIGFANAKNCTHLAYDVVELPDGAMSSRKGNIVPMETLIKNMVELIKTRYLNQYLGQTAADGTLWTTEVVEQTANEVALGAIFYGMLRIDPQRKIVFDMDEWLKLDGESGPYLQYAQARIRSLVQKVRATDIGSTELNWHELQAKQEVLLALKLIQFNSVSLQAAENNRPSQLCGYLFDVAKLYNSFYAECSVVHAETKSLARARLALSEATGAILREGLKLLGIPAPQRM